jgi:peptidoglycan/xylan/chitin deacetylase (PgdA/CDA1 family)
MDAVSKEDFRRHLEILGRHFHVVSLEQLCHEVENGSVRKNSICITFDDGYRDNYDVAFPLLREYGLPATIFLATDFIGTGKLLWHDKVLLAIQHTRRKQLRWPFEDGIDLPLGDQAHQVARQLLMEIKYLPPSRRTDQIAALLRHCEVEPDRETERLMLDWQEVRGMDRQGIFFGAHTRSHPILTGLDEATIAQEVSGSKREIEEQLGHDIFTFAYPNGQARDFDATVKQVLQTAGFRCAVTTLSGVNFTHADRFAWRRGRPWENDGDRFLARLLLMRV